MKVLYNINYVSPDGTTGELAGKRIVTDPPTDNRYIDVYTAPTQNCQVFTIAWFEILLHFYLNNKKDKAIEIIREAKKIAGNKRLLLIDIHENRKDDAKDLLSSSEVLIDENYTSTNGSEMCIMLIKLPSSF